MNANQISIFRNRARAAVASVPRTKVIAFLLIVIVPGGLVVPACYAVYHAIRHSLHR